MRRGTIASGVLIDEADIPAFGGRSIYVGSNGYAYVSIWPTGARTVHSIVMGEIPRGHHIDHINGNRLDNRRANLRVVTPQINQVNRRTQSRANSSGIRGVSHAPHLSKRNPWRAQIAVGGRNFHLGLFPTESDAVAARRDAELRYFGEECPRG